MHEQCFTPQVLEQFKLVKHVVVDKKHVEKVRFFVIKNGFSLHTVGVIEIEQVHKVHGVVVELL